MLLFFLLSLLLLPCTSTYNQNQHFLRTCSSKCFTATTIFHHIFHNCSSRFHQSPAFLNGTTGISLNQGNCVIFQLLEDNFSCCTRTWETNSLLNRLQRDPWSLSTILSAWLQSAYRIISFSSTGPLSSPLIHHCSFELGPRFSQSISYSSFNFFICCNTLLLQCLYYFLSLL